MDRNKKKKSIGAAVEAFSEENFYPVPDYGKGNVNIPLKKSGLLKGRNNISDFEEKEKILGFVREVFLKEGFYKTTMDEIAAKLHMSKKTIYKHFPSKEILVKDIMERHMKITIEGLKNNVKKQGNAVEKLFDIFTLVGQTIIKVNEKMIMDLQSYSPALWKQVDEFRAKQITANFTKIFEQGKAEGFFLNIKTEIILAIFISSIRSIVNPDYAINSGISLRESFESIIEILMNGILNEKGKKIFNKLKNGVTK